MHQLLASFRLSDLPAYVGAILGVIVLPSIVVWGCVSTYRHHKGRAAPAYWMFVVATIVVMAVIDVAISTAFKGIGE